MKKYAGNKTKSETMQQRKYTHVKGENMWDKSMMLLKDKFAKTKHQSLLCIAKSNKEVLFHPFQK